jgi:hypothetical protein
MPSLTDIPMLKKEHREIGIGFAAAAGLALVIAALTHGWLVNPYIADIHMGLISTQLCQSHEHCESHTNFELMSTLREAAERQDSVVETMQMEGRSAFADASTDNASDVSGAFAPAGLVAMIACIIGGLALMATAVLAFKKIRLALPLHLSTISLIAIMVSLIFGCIFIATKPGGMRGVGVGYSFWIFGAASVAGIIGAQILNKLVKPPEKAWTA